MKAIAEAFQILFLLATGHNRKDVYETITGDRPTDDVAAPMEVFSR